MTSNQAQQQGTADGAQGRGKIGDQHHSSAELWCDGVCAAVQQWRGDGMWVYDGPAGLKAFAWRIELGDEATALRAAQLLTVGLTGARQVGTRVVVAGISDGHAPTWAFDP